MVVEGNDRNAVIDLVTETVGCIVDEDHIFEVSVDDSEVLDVETLGCDETTFSEECCTDVLSFRVEMLDDLQ